MCFKLQDRMCLQSKKSFVSYDFQSLFVQLLCMSVMSVMSVTHL